MKTTANISFGNLCRFILHRWQKTWTVYFEMTMWGDGFSKSTFKIVTSGLKESGSTCKALKIQLRHKTRDWKRGTFRDTGLLFSPSTLFLQKSVFKQGKKIVVLKKRKGSGVALSLSSHNWTRQRFVKKRKHPWIRQGGNLRSGQLDWGPVLRVSVGQTSEMSPKQSVTLGAITG